MEDLELTLEKNNSNEFFDSNEEKTELEEGRLHLVLSFYVFHRLFFF